MRFILSTPPRLYATEHLVKSLRRGRRWPSITAPGSNSNAGASDFHFSHRGGPES